MSHNDNYVNFHLRNRYSSNLEAVLDSLPPSTEANMRVLWTVLLCCAVASTPSWAQVARAGTATCPDVSVQIGSAVYSSPGNGGSFGSLDAMVNYELAVSVRFNALISSFASTTVSARLRDRYRLVGQPSADPVPIRVRMPVSL